MGILPGINATALVRATVVIAFWATALSASCAGAQDAAWTGPKLEKARALLDSVIAPRYEHAGRTPEAISVAVALGGTRVYADGRGRARPDVMAGPETVYRIGSITKQFLAVALLDAIEAHRLVADNGALVDLDSKISSILQEGAAWDEAGFPPLTLRSLLTMTSDIVNFTRKPPAELDPWGAAPAPELRKAIAHTRRTLGDGSFSYSNTGYFLLSEILRTSRPDASYREAMREFAFSKAGLENTGFTGQQALESALAKPSYGRRPAFLQPDWLQGSADVLSSATDLCRWNTALMRGEVLTPRSLSQMFSDAARVDVWTYYGMGWFISHKNGADTFFHSGSVPGYTSFNAIYRHTDAAWVSVSILTNADDVEGLPELAEALSDMALSEN